MSLMKSLDSRRPVDLEKSLEMIQAIAHRNPPLSEFNFAEHKSTIQLSGTARAQLFIHAAKGIEEAQKILGAKLERLIAKKGITGQNVFMIVLCLRRLILEYRLRLGRHQQLNNGTVLPHVF